jgi:hypothetical protein
MRGRSATPPFIATPFLGQLLLPPAAAAPAAAAGGRRARPTGFGASAPNHPNHTFLKE